MLLEIREDDRESSSIDAIRLLRVDHSPSWRTGITSDGMVFEYTHASPPLTAVDDRGIPCLDLLAVPEGGALRGTAGSVVHLTFDLSAPGIVVLSRVPEPGIKSVGPVITRARPGRGSGSPDVIGTGIPRHAGGEQFFELSSPAPPGGDLTLSLSWIDPVAVDFIGTIEGWREVRPRELPLDRAVHSRWGDVADDLLVVDGRRVRLDPGQRIRLEYVAREVPEGQVSAYFLMIDGHYEKPRDVPGGPDGAGAVETGATRSEASPGIDMRPASSIYLLDVPSRMPWMSRDDPRS